MVEFEFKPIEKVVVHEILKWSMGEVVQRLVKPNSKVQWADGIVFIRSNYQTMTPQMADDAANGIVHWALIEFAEMPEMKPQLINENTSAVASVNDVSNNNVFGDLVRWLRNDPRWFPKNSI